MVQKSHLIFCLSLWVFKCVDKLENSLWQILHFFLYLFFLVNMLSDSHLIQARRFRPARFRPNDSGRTIQAGHDSGRSRFRPVTIQAHLDSGQICTIQAWHDSGPTTQAGHDSGQSRFRPVTIQAHLYSGRVSTIQAQYARFRPNRHNSGQTRLRPDTIQANCA